MNNFRLKILEDSLKVLEDKIKNFEDRLEEITNIVEQIQNDIEQLKDVGYNEFVGMKITDHYCNGFFDSDYDLKGATIIGNTRNTLTIRKTNGEIKQADMYGYNMRELVKNWTADREDEDEWEEWEWE